MTIPHLFQIHMVSRKKLGKHIVEITKLFYPQCGNYGILVSHFFGKNFVKATVLLNKSLKSWFDEIFFQWDQIFHFSTLCTGNHGILLPRSIRKNYVKSTFHLRMLLAIDWFEGEKYCVVGYQILVFPNCGAPLFGFGKTRNFPSLGKFLWK